MKIVQRADFERRISHFLDRALAEAVVAGYFEEESPRTWAEVTRVLNERRAPTKPLAEDTVRQRVWRGTRRLISELAREGIRKEEVRALIPEPT